MSYNVLHLVDHLNENCGMSLSTMRMVTALKEKGFQGEILTGPGSAIQKARDNDIKVSLFKSFSKKKTPGNLLSLITDINRKIQENDIDQLHAHHRLLGFVGWFLARWHGIPIVHYDHNALYGNKHTSYWGDLIVTGSKANKRHLKNYFNIAENKIVTCYEFTDLRDLKNSAVKGANAPTHIGQLGRLAKQKGQKHLLKGFKKYLAINEDATLTIKGDGPLRDDLQEQARSLGIAANVMFEPPDNDIKSFFDSIDCFVLSSLHEGTCMVAVEAAASGLPIIATKVGGVGDYLTNNKSALLIKPGEPDEIFDALKKMKAMGGQKRKKMAANARQNIDQIFDREKQADMLSEVFHQINGV